MSQAQTPVERITSYANKSEAWRNRIGIFLWLIGTVLLIAFASQMSVPVLLFCGGLWIGVLGLVASKSWLLFLGPVFFYDAVRLGRRKWVFWFRTLFAMMVGALLLLMYRDWFVYRAYDGDSQFSIKRFAEFAREFFDAFAIIQLIVIALLTPAHIAPAISEEKERRTLEFLFATDLRNREILFGKLAARLGTLTLFLLAGLPILTLTQFFGGVDPNQVIVLTLATFILMLFLAAIAIWCSVSVKKSRDAIALAFLIPIAYVVVSGIGYGLARQAQAFGSSWMLDSVTLFGERFSVADLFIGFSRGNLLPLLLELEDNVRRGAVYTVELWELLGQFALFHLFSIALFLIVAVLRLRPLGLKQSGGGSESKSKEKKGRRHPEVGNSPMVWKEIYVESTFRAGWLGRSIVILIAALTLVPAILITYDIFFAGRQQWYLRVGYNEWDLYSDRMNEYVRTVSTLVSVLLLISASIRGAGSVRGEKDKQTFDSLMTSPLTVRQILWGKWWGCMVGNRFGLWWLGIIWLIGLASGGLHPLAVPLLLLALTVFMGAYSWYGIWCSINCTTTLRATTWAFSGGIFLGGGYFIVVGICCFLPGIGREDEGLIRFLTGMSPPVTLSYLPFYSLTEELNPYRTARGEMMEFFALIGFIAWCAFAYILSVVSTLKFRRDNNRMGHRNDDPLSKGMRDEG